MKSDQLIYDHIAIVLALCAQHMTLSNLFTKQYLFLNSNSDTNDDTKQTQGPIN